MATQLTRKHVEKLVGKLLGKLQREECFTCDCLHAFLMQLRLDADGEEVGELLARHAVPSESMHPCLGCRPCLPSEAFADYIRKQQG